MISYRAGILLTIIAGAGVVRGEGSPSEHLEAAKLAATITVQVLVTDYNGKALNRKTGTGTIIDATGIVATCSHVLGRAQQIKVRPTDGRYYSATLVGRFPEHDLAVLRFDPPKEMRAVPRLHPGLLPPKTACICLGFPAGKRSMCPATLRGYLPNADTNLIAPSTPIVVFEGRVVPGYSGGPLMTLDGGLIGVVFATTPEKGVAIAIPIDVLMNDLKRLPPMEVDASPAEEK